MYLQRNDSLITGAVTDEYANSNFFEQEFSLKRNSEAERSSINSEISYNRPFGNISTNAGYRFNWSNTHLESANSYFNESVDNLKYDLAIHYFYVNMSSSLGSKFFYQIGVAADYFQSAVNIDYKTNYSKIYPILYLQYQITGNQNLTFNFRSYRNKLSATMLNPVNTSTDTMKIVSGNPYLKPYSSYFAKLTYNLNIGNFYFAPEVYCTISENGVVRVSETDAKGIYHETFKNISSRYNISPSLSFSFKPFDWWTLSLYLSYEYAKYEDKKNALFNEGSGLWYGPRSTFSYKKLSLECWYTQQGTNVGSTSKTTMGKNLHTTLRYRINKKWNVSTSTSYFAETSKTQTNTPTYDEIFTQTNHDRFMMIRFSVSYRFSKGLQIEKYKKIENKEGKIEIK